MASYSLEVRGWKKVSAELGQWLANFHDPSEITANISALLESQTKRRISDEKTAPDGSPWKPWTPEYARTRQPKHSLLIDTQNLLDSIAGSFTKKAARVGTNVSYAPAVQKQRPFLGLSKDNRAEVMEMLTDWMNSLTP